MNVYEILERVRLGMWSIKLLSVSIVGYMLHHENLEVPL